MSNAWTILCYGDMNIAPLYYMRVGFIIEYSSYNILLNTRQQKLEDLVKSLHKEIKRYKDAAE